ncbi:hypothetical protein K491DRAFT_427007 [Lophiostoma macrostomum CBS 122681]|uniref:Uncharacterized protein n=1 Tax=Lophiostoma macrostomum CBS 122681 TaxID=1314788 RepID=A0A6A6T6W9_9PLEO|nr:hypothetical protein K491DRAFT_427007 [Lophiostoma macrostomum CBS 122681]
MGFVTTGKPLQADHPFLLSDVSNASRTATISSAVETGEGKDVESEHGDDDEEDEIVQGEHGIDEWQSDEDDANENGNEFFDAPEYIDDTEDKDG